MLLFHVVLSAHLLFDFHTTNRLSRFIVNMNVLPIPFQDINFLINEQEAIVNQIRRIIALTAEISRLAFVIEIGYGPSAFSF